MTGHVLGNYTKGTAIVPTSTTIGFVRVRRRVLKGGNYRDIYYTKRAYAGRATASTSYDIVRAERVDGKPRHRFVLGLGSLKEPRIRDPEDDPRIRDHYYVREVNLPRFWANAFRRMRLYGLDESQRRHIANQMLHKGAPLPTAEMLKPPTSQQQDYGDFVRWLEENGFQI
jgi:hypothetical protein